MCADMLAEFGKDNVTSSSGVQFLDSSPNFVCNQVELDLSMFGVLYDPANDRILV